MNDEKVLSIFPNTKGYGYVVLRAGKLLDYGVIKIRPTNTEKCIRKITETIQYHQPEILIVRKCIDSKKCNRIQRIVKIILDHLDINIKVYMYSRKEVEDIFEIHNAKNKYEISKKVSEIYPIMRGKLPEKRKLWNPEDYYQGMFDAMALYLTHSHIRD